MAREIVIDPVTRIEGHARITIQVGQDGKVSDARFHVTQFRGFEKFCEGRPFHEMPAITARICGICPVSHLIASAKACDALLAVAIPPAAVKLRRLINLGQLVQSHALSFFYLSAPDLMLGMDADPALRNIFGLIQNHPQAARDGIRLRQFGQQVVEWLGGKRVHPSWVVPGGVSKPLEREVRERILSALPEMTDIARRTLDSFKRILERCREEVRTFGNFPTLFMSLVTPEGGLELYDGKLRVADAHGEVLADQVDTDRYADLIGEAVEPWTYLKFPYYRPTGYPDGIYRVGPLARLNLAERCGTPLGDGELAEYKDLQPGPQLASFYYHYARLIEIIYALERMEQLLSQPDILETHVRAEAGVNALEGIGVSEAPRGTLIHHYQIDEHGLIRSVNLIVATTHNNLAMNRSVAQVARQFVAGDKLEEAMLNRVEAVVRAYDPCLSCSTHAFGRMPLCVDLIGPDGCVLDRLKRP